MTCIDAARLLALKARLKVMRRRRDGREILPVSHDGRPEARIEAMLAQLRKWFDLDVQEVSVAREDVSFKLPKAVSAAHG